MNPNSPADLPAATWRKSTRSSGGGSNCVEVACLPSHIAIRDSKNSEGGTLIVTTAVFRELTGGIRRGDECAACTAVALDVICAVCTLSHRKS